MKCPPDRPVLKEEVNTGTCCDDSINVAIRAMNNYEQYKYDYEVRYCKYAEDLEHWGKRTGKFEDPISTHRNGIFVLDGTTPGMPNKCSKGNPEHFEENRQLCKTWARNFGSPYYNDYTTVDNGSKYCGTYMWQPRCSRQSNDQYEKMKPQPPGGKPDLPSINMACTCCQQRVDFSDLKAGGNINTSDIKAICNLDKTSQPTSSSPTTTNPTTSNPTTSNPTTTNPTTSNPTTSNPTTSNPTTSNFTTSNPTPSPFDIPNVSKTLSTLISYFKTNYILISGVGITLCCLCVLLIMMLLFLE